MRSATRSARAHRESANPSGGVMATRRNANGAGEASVPPAPSSSERETLDASVASLSGLNLDQLRLQWRNHLGGIAPAHLPGWLLMRVLAYRIQATAFDPSWAWLLSRPDDHSFLAGKLYDDRGNRMGASHASKGGRRWRYYVSRAAAEGQDRVLTLPRTWKPSRRRREIIQCVRVEQLDQLGEVGKRPRQPSSLTRILATTSSAAAASSCTATGSGLTSSTRTTGRRRWRRSSIRRPNRFRPSSSH